MANVVHGSDVKLDLWITDSWFQVLCGTDCTFTLTQEMIMKTGPNSGAWRERVPGISEWSASVSGLTKIDNTVEALTFFYTLQPSVRNFVQQIRLTFTDEDGGSKQVSGDAFITSQNINGPVTDFSNAVINFEGTGEVVISTTPPPSPNELNVYSDYWQTVNGQNYIDGASALQAYTLGVNDTILEVDVDGHQYDVVTGTPGNRECVFNSGTGRITFETGFNFDGNQRVFVEFLRII